MRRGEKIPEDWVKCPVCDRQYGFIRCRITSQAKNYCLRCFIEQRDARLQTGGSARKTPNT